mmetsp:Transcript_16582/g.24947  ORF Transcript_16582/g.24947 Transcript_16582/m.24947 type:complete len:537 (-) Transcript_16582:176-1786(-)
METIPILYRVEGDREDNINCFDIEVYASKEVLLFDILKAWSIWHPIGINFTFYARASGENMIHLESPACCVPVIDGKIFLLLKPSSYFPYAPAEQTVAWFEKSQRDVYGTSTSVASRFRQSFFHQSSRGKSDKSTQGSRASPQQGSQSRSQAEKAKEISSGKREQSGKSSTPPSSNSGGIDINQLAGAAEAASQAGMEAAGVAARSLFNFAASTLKTVASSASSFSTGSVLQVGEHRVSFIRDLAEGGFGKVSLVKDANTQGSYYAMKTLLCQTKEQLADANNELRMLQRFRGHPNIINLVDNCNVAVGKKNSNTRQLYFLFPIYHVGTCWDLIEAALSGGDSQLGPPSCWCFNERQALEIILGTARALIALHDSQVLHNDMKPHNILLTDDMQPVVMDLGSSGPYMQVRTRREALMLEEDAAIKCSAPYRSPELTQVPNSCDIGGWCDIWSLGCTMYCLAFGWSPFESPKEGVLKLAILNGRYSIPSQRRNRDTTFSAEYVELIESMLQVDYTLRPTAEAVKNRVKELMEAHGGY